jgi:TolA-binding protein
MSRAMTRGLLSLACTLSFACSALAQGTYTKAYVADRIRKVEDGVDQFRDWTKKQGENAQSRTQSAQNSGQTPRRSRANTSNTQARQDQAKNTKNDLEDALDDLNRSTNRLRRKFDATDKWMETKVQVEQVVEDGRRINQVMVRGKYGTQAERYWGVLRKAINDLARTYAVTPLGA